MDRRSDATDICQKDGLDTILIIDDDPMVRMLMTESLHQTGFTILEADDGRAGLELFDEHRPQLVLVDLQMPGMDGFTFCSTLRALPYGRDTPIVVVTGLDDVESIEQAYDCGATDFISKPINWAVLHHRIQYILRSSQSMQSARKNSNLLAEAQRIAKLGNWTWDTDNKELFVSEECYRIFSVPRVAPDIFHKLLLNAVHKDDKNSFDVALSKAHDGHATDTAFRVLLPNGQDKTILMYIDSNPDSQQPGSRLFGTIQDISAQRKAEAAMRQLAYYDSVTGLPNRDLFKEHLNMGLHQARRSKSKIAVMFLDLDNFKRVNDSLGHVAGDQLLKIISQRLQESVRSSDMAARDTSDIDTSLARLGGDEFTIMLSGLHGIKHIDMVAQRILQRICEPVTLSGNRVRVSASIGIAIYPEDGGDIDTLLKHADAAMYEVKAKGRNGVFFYDDALRQQSQHRLQIENELHQAIEQNQLKLLYQPKVDSQTQQTLGFEALIRWVHPEKGIISPMDFIPVAEDCGLIIPIGKWVIRAACHQQQAWHQAGLPRVRVSINLSAHQFTDTQLLQAIRDILQETGVQAEHLEFEITETVLMQDADAALHILKEMKAMGLTISIDDFGTGYSSISYLKHFPVDVLKIDRAFIKDLPDNQQDATITTAIITLAKALNLQVVAEGVETRAQLQWLRGKDCDQIQGYLFSPPVAPEQAADMLGKSFPQDN